MQSHHIIRLARQCKQHCEILPCSKSIGSNQYPRAIFTGEFARDFVGAIVILELRREVIGLADIKLAGWILKNIDAIRG
jgi:hypothetical protein